MAHYVIVGAGPAGLYTAYRLLKSGKIGSGDTLNVYEWGQRPGGRIFTYTFPPSITTDGLYVELGGMRFATDGANFKPSMTPDSNTTSIVDGHVLVQNMIVEMGLADKVVHFEMSPNRKYYLRGKTFLEDTITSTAVLPYNFNAEFDQFVAPLIGNETLTADNVMGALGTKFGPPGNPSREDWCKYFAGGAVSQANASAAYPAGTPVQYIGYWNLLYDQLGDEGFDYLADGGGYTSNVINWNSADAMQANGDYGSGAEYSRLLGGYGLLFDALAAAIEQLSPGCIQYGRRLAALVEGDGKSTCYFLQDGSDNPEVIRADYLFLALPRRALEMVAQKCSDTHVLNCDQMRSYRESSINQPAIKAVMVFDQPWYTDASLCAQPLPVLVAPSNGPHEVPNSQKVGGPTITDLPLRMVYYFGHNTPGTSGGSGGPYVVLASYDDMNFSDFWRVLEVQGDYTNAPSLTDQPLHGPAQMGLDSAFTQLLLKQLAETHGIPLEKMPQPIAVYYQDWGQDPYGAGYHAWAAHYNICEVMDKIRAPYQKVRPPLAGPSANLYIIGSCYSFDQAWVEGAFCTAESVLQDFLGLPAFRNVQPSYTLVCKA